MLLLCAPALAAPLALGTSAAVGVDAQVHRGGMVSRARVDLLDVELHIGEHLQVVPRLGRFAVGLAALEVVDVEIDVLARFGSPEPGWQAFAAVGVGPKFARGAAETVLGIAVLGRVGGAWRPVDGARRVHVYAEPVLTLEAGRSVQAVSAGLRAGAALTWRL